MTRRRTLGNGLVEVDSESGLKGHMRADFGLPLEVGALSVASYLERWRIPLVSVEVVEGEAPRRRVFYPEDGRLV